MPSLMTLVKDENTIHTASLPKHVKRESTRVKSLMDIAILEDNQKNKKSSERLQVLDEIFPIQVSSDSARAFKFANN